MRHDPENDCECDKELSINQIIERLKKNKMYKKACCLKTTHSEFQSVYGDHLLIANWSRPFPP